jgi:hypothetical protein
MKTSNPFSFAALKIRSMFSTVLFSLTLSPTNPPREASITQHFILRVDEDHCGVILVNVHG